MALEYVGGLTTGFNGVTPTGSKVTVSLANLTGGLASAPSIGDVVFVAYAANSNIDRRTEMTIASGDGFTYTQISSLYSGSASAAQTSLRVAYRRLTTTNTSLVLGNISNATAAGLTVSVHVWRGVHPTSPIDTTPATGSFGLGTSTPSISFSTILPIREGAVILVAGAGGGTSVVYSSSDLSNFRTVRQTNTYQSVNGIGSYAWTSGSYKPANWTGGSTGYVGGSYAWSMFAIRPAGASQVLSPSFDPYSNVLYGPAVNPGPVSLASSLLTNSQTFYNPTVGRGVVSVQPPLLSNTQSFYTQAIEYGAVNIRPPLHTNTQSFFSPSISPGSVNLSASFLNSSQVLYPPNLTVGAWSVTPQRIINSQVFYTPSITAGLVSLSPNSLQNTQSFYAPFIGGNLLVTGSATGQCSVAGNLKLSSGLASASAVSGFATANLQIKRELVGNSAGYVTASGYLAYSCLLAGSVTGSISASGSLPTAAQNSLSAIALVTAVAQANMSLHKGIAGNVSSSLSAMPTTLVVGTLKQLIGNTSLSVQALGLLAKTNNQAADVLVSVNAYGALNQGISLNGAVSFSSNAYSTVYVNKHLNSNQVVLFNCSGRLVKLTQTSFDTITVAVKPDYIWAAIDVDTIKVFAIDVNTIKAFAVV